MYHFVKIDVLSHTGTGLWSGGPEEGSPWVIGSRKTLEAYIRSGTVGNSPVVSLEIVVPPPSSPPTARVDEWTTLPLRRVRTPVNRYTSTHKTHRCPTVTTVFRGPQCTPYIGSTEVVLSGTLVTSETSRRTLPTPPTLPSLQLCPDMTGNRSVRPCVSPETDTTEARGFPPIVSGPDPEPPPLPYLRVQGGSSDRLDVLLGSRVSLLVAHTCSYSHRHTDRERRTRVPIPGGKILGTIPSTSPIPTP